MRDVEAHWQCSRRQALAIHPTMLLKRNVIPADPSRPSRRARSRTAVTQIMAWWRKAISAGRDKVRLPKPARRGLLAREN
jgi:hypothetical protein